MTVFAALAFHRIAEHPESAFDVSWDAFRRHLDALHSAGFVVEGIGALGARVTQGDPLPARYVLATFDDGYDSDLRAGEELHARGFSATFAVVTDWMGRQGHMTMDEVAELATRHEVASHTVTHPVLATANPITVRRELVESREHLASAVGRCDTLALPGGSGGRAVAKEARRAGYEWVATSRPSYNNLAWATRTRRIARVGVHREDDTARVMSLAWCDPRAIAVQFARYPLVLLGQRYLPYGLLARVRRRFGRYEGPVEAPE